MNILIAGHDCMALYAGVALRQARPDWRVTIAGAPAASAGVHILANPVKPDFHLRGAELDAAMRKAAFAPEALSVVRMDGGREEQRINGLAYLTIADAALCAILQDAARAAGCAFASAEQISALAAQADLVVCVHPELLPQLGPDAAKLAAPLQHDRPLHIRIATRAVASTLAFGFARTAGGLVRVMHVPSGRESGELIVETGAAGESALQAAREILPSFADDITAASASAWTNVPVRVARSRHAGKLAIIGAAASLPHYSVGLAARSGFEDAEALADALAAQTGIPEALAAWQALRLPKADSLHRAADSSAAWLANAEQHFGMQLNRFAMACVTRSLRLTYTHVKAADPAFAREVDAVVAGPAIGAGNEPPPPMFTPYSMRDLTIPNRMSFSPMCMYSSREGTVSDFQLVHLGTRAVGGFGLVFAEMTNVTPQGRMTYHCAGMYSPEHVPAFKRITDYVHEHTEAKIAIQLAHAGRKGSISRSWEKGIPLTPEEEWETLAPSPIPYQQGRPLPREMSAKDIQDVTDAFARAARMSDEAGFDMIEIHGAHGYLLSSFISPLSNRRTDAYGGSLKNRMRFPLEVFEAVRANFPSGKPISVRISASDWRPDGIQPRDAIEISRMFHERGADIIAVSSSGVTPERRPTVVERLYQLPFSDAIRNEGKVPTMTVGGVLSHGDCNTIIASGRADICLMARGALNEPYFPQHAARQQGYKLPWTFPYARAAETPVRAG